ncbi:hypothetical protein [Cytobacillus sp. FSL H8-0458]|uniref:hypothetical protein n=1 Tax=Cytobacillus sp. FSL H8-0458 TaxID=2975346 RepID=UPI0030FC040C
MFNSSLEHEDFLNEDCPIEKVMIEAEKRKKDEMNNKYIADIAKEIEFTKNHKMNCNQSG